jgi:hypothetical protein
MTKLRLFSFALLLASSACQVQVRSKFNVGGASGQRREPTSESSVEGSQTRRSSSNQDAPESDEPERAKTVATTKPKSTLDVWLIGQDKKIKSDQFEKADDMIALMAKLDRSLLVHTKTAGKFPKFCAHTFESQNDCKSFNDKDEPTPLWNSDVPGHPHRVGWTTNPRSPYIGSGINAKAMTPLAPNTPGFIVWGVYGTSGDNQKVMFLALDGGTYYLDLAALELGPGDVSTWPKDVQHSSFALSVVLEGHKKDPPRPIDLPQDMIDELREKEAKLLDCSEKAWDAAEPEFRANRAANITEQTRKNREFQLREKHMDAANKRCKSQLNAIAKSYTKVLDHRLSQRKRIYEAAKKRFGS